MDEEKDQHVTAAPVTADNVQIEQDGNGWRMPEPVFRQSSGSLPKSFEKKIRSDNDGMNAATATAVASPAAAKDAPAAPTTTPIADVQPQPDLSEQLLPEPAEESASEKPKRSRGMKILFALLGIVAMVTFAIIFLGIVYCLFFSESGCQDIYYYFRPNESSGF